MITNSLFLSAGSTGGVSVIVIQNSKGWFKRGKHSEFSFEHGSSEVPVKFKWINNRLYKSEHQQSDQDKIYKCGNHKHLSDYKMMGENEISKEKNITWGEQWEEGNVSS